MCVSVCVCERERERERERELKFSGKQLLFTLNGNAVSTDGLR